MSESGVDLHQREAAFHDAWARSTPLGEISLRAAFEASTAPENRLILELMGPLDGKRLLDLGTGLGESAVYFALRGARVTMVDVSAEMIRLAQALAAHHGVEVDGRVGPAESIDLEPESFDFVYMANLVHHVPPADRARLFATVRRALVPGGRFFSWDPVAYNPIINVYRRIAMGVRTEDEAPLRRRDIAIARDAFPDLQTRSFWLLSLTLFLKYFLWDRVHPRADRYWKRILREPEERLGWLRFLQRLDALLLRLPGLRWVAWNLVLWGTKS